MTEFDLDLGARNVRLIDYDWSALTFDEHGCYIADLFDVVMLGDHREAKALSRALEGIETAIEQHLHLAPVARHLLAAGQPLRQRAAGGPMATWLVASMDAVLEVADCWAAAKPVPEARHQDLCKWLRACRLCCECNAIGTDTTVTATGARLAVDDTA